jgi:hypothetical protein
MPVSRLSRFISPLAVATLVLVPGLLGAQEGLREVRPEHHGVYGGINLSVGVPTGEFDQNVNVSPGIGLNVVIPFTSTGSLGVLIQGGVLIYGSQTRRIPLAGTSGLVSVDLTTTNYLGFLGAGLQYSPRHGGFRPYLNGTLGGSYLATESEVKGTNNVESFANTTNFDDLVFAATAGGGFYVPVGKKIAIDLGAQFHWGGQADYLTKHGIIDNGDGTTSFNPSTSRTDLVRIQVGLEFGI